MPTEKRPLKVFLCHARDDKSKANELYRYLRKRGIQPWLDTQNLLPGQDWKVEIPKAITSSDVIVICLSKNSVDKKGYVQTEIKFALDMALEIPEGRIFLIPARLEECGVPFSLQRYQWVDLFDESGYSKLMKSLKVRASQLERATVQVSKQDENSPYLTEKPKYESHDGITVHVNGNVEGNIIIGNENAVQMGMISSIPENIDGEEAKKIVQEKVEQERLASEKVEAKRIADKEADEERILREKAEVERIAQEKAEAERIADEQRLAFLNAENERIAKEERLLREKAEAEKIVQEKIEQERVAREKAEAKRLADEETKKERLLLLAVENERIGQKQEEQEATKKAERERLAREAPEKIANEQAEGGTIQKAILQTPDEVVEEIAPKQGKASDIKPGYRYPRSRPGFSAEFSHNPNKDDNAEYERLERETAESEERETTQKVELEVSKKDEPKPDKASGESEYWYPRSRPGFSAEFSHLTTQLDYTDIEQLESEAAKKVTLEQVEKEQKTLASNQRQRRIWRPKVTSTLVGAVVIFAAILGFPALIQRFQHVATATQKIAPVFTATLITTSTPTITFSLTPTITHTVTSTITPTLTPKAGTIWTRPADQMVMVYVPGATFKMGSDMRNDEQPIHDVTLNSFWIDRTEVTNAMYKLCVLIGGCFQPADLRFYDKDDYPVVFVNWDQANTYCKWADARLPNEAEWEYAARGTDGRIYPWGNQVPNATLTHYGGRVNRPTTVESHPAGASPFDVLDMAGNVWEWVDDWYDSTYYSHPVGTPTGIEKVWRAGSFKYAPPNYLRTSDRDKNFPNAAYDDLGFRCARSIP